MKGGMAVQIISPKGSYFASANLGPQANEGIHFRGASTTKTFTAASILLLQQQGKLNIDDTLVTRIPGTSTPYVPDLPAYDIPYKDKITIRQILGHRAGVFDISNTDIPDDAKAPYAGKSYLSYIRQDLKQDDHTFTFDELVGVVATNRLSYFAPGTGFHYSDTGYSILGKIIERVSGKDYAAFVQEYFLSPYGLANTSFPSRGNEQVIPAPFAEGYVWFGGETMATTRDNMSAHVAEGNVITTPRDLARWGQLLYSGKAGLEKKYVDLMTDLKPTGESHLVYGLGTEYTSGLGHGHNGGHLGYLTLMRYDPLKDVAVVAFTSGFDASDIYYEAFLLSDTLIAARQMLGY
jgi:D-alanyl-D-alanine carboxypeptidase